MHTGRLLQQAASYARDHPTAAANITGQPAAPPDIEFRGVSVAVGGVPVLRRIDLGVARGTITSLIGATGPAKDALVEVILGRRQPDAGDVFVLGRPTAGLSERGREELARQVGVVPRTGDLIGTISVADNVAAVLRHEPGMPDHEVDRIVAERLDELGLASATRLLADQLGPGSRKLVALARALALDPQLVVCDEPEAGFDDDRRDLLTELVGRLHAGRERTYLMLTQDVATAVRLSHELAFVYAGQLVARGTPAVLAASPNPHVRALVTRADDGGGLSR